MQNFLPAKVASLKVVGGKQMKSRKGVTQGDTSTMGAYILRVTPLVTPLELHF